MPERVLAIVRMLLASVPSRSSSGRSNCWAKSVWYGTSPFWFRYGTFPATGSARKASQEMSIIFLRIACLSSAPAGVRTRPDPPAPTPSGP